MGYHCEPYFKVTETLCTFSSTAIPPENAEQN